MRNDKQTDSEQATPECSLVGGMWASGAGGFCRASSHSGMVGTNKGACKMLLKLLCSNQGLGLK